MIFSSSGNNLVPNKILSYLSTYPNVKANSTCFPSSLCSPHSSVKVTLLFIAFFYLVLFCTLKIFHLSKLTKHFVIFFFICYRFVFLSAHHWFHCFGFFAHRVPPPHTNNDWQACSDASLRFWLTGTVVGKSIWLQNTGPEHGNLKCIILIENLSLKKIK